jgi:glycosyltransferase involved in cell wall biosynthesis
MKRTPRIVFTCGREPHYTRNDVLLRALRKHFNLIEVTDRREGSLTARLLRLTPRLIAALRQSHDLVVVGFYGYPLVWLIRHLTRRPLLFDAFLSTYDTLVEDRGRFRRGSLPARLALRVDRAGAWAADRVLLDTQAQAIHFAGLTGLPASRVSSLFVSCNEDLFHPGVTYHHADDNTFTVLTYGTYQPLHGMEVVVEAAALLGDAPKVRWRIIGSGQTYPQVRALAERRGAINVEFLPPVPYSALPTAIAGAHLCLGGPFGTSSKARRVITGKTFQFLSMGKAVIVADTTANRELLTAKSARFVPPGSPDALAAAVHDLYRDPVALATLAHEGHSRYRERASEAVIAERLRQQIEELVS